MIGREYTIQELIEDSGVARRNIYFYTQQGILPPPSGAGLAARYGEIHLLRLKAIPVLRSRGLRLDDIRQQLVGESLEDLRKIISAREVVREERIVYPASPAGRVVTGREVKQYDLPGGVTITAPLRMTAEERQRLEKLLEAASQIYHLHAGI